MAKKLLLTVEDKYRLLLQIANQTSDTLDLDVILNQLLDQMHTLIAYDAAGIFVLVRDLVHPRTVRPRGVIAGVARRGFDERPPETDPMLSLGKGIIGHVIASGESLVLPDVRADPRYVAGRQRTLSEIAVPILRNERPIGALNLESDQLGTFSEEDLEALRFFADAAALSIEKATLHRQLLEKEHLKDQLRTARQVQSHLLPVAPPNIPGFELVGVSLPTYEIGGDYYDFIPFETQRCGIVAADVSGDGVPAALVMSALRVLLRTHAREEENPARLAETLNCLLPEFSGKDYFVTAVYLLLDAQDGRICYVNCGHNPPLLFRKAGQVEKLECRGPALGVFAQGNYTTHEERLAVGDVLVLFTDGVVELTDAEGDFFGEERLVQAVLKARKLPAATIIQTILQTTQAFSGTELYHDDFTLLILKRTGEMVYNKFKNKS